MQLLNIIIGIVVSPILFICLKLLSWVIKYQYHKTQLPPIPRQKTTFPVISSYGDGYHDWFLESFDALRDPKNSTGMLCQGPQMGGDVMIAVTHPDIYKEILSHPEKYPKYAMYEGLRPFMGYGLILLKGDQWKKERRMLTPLFYHGSLKLQVLPMADIASLMIDRLRSLKSEPTEPKFRQFSLRIIISAAFGNAFDIDWMYDKYEYLGTLIGSYLMLVAIFGTDIAPSLPLPPIWKLNATIKEIHDKLGEHIAIRRKQILESDSVSLSSSTYDPEATEDMTTLMLRSDPDIPDERIVNEGLTLLFAGLDTTDCVLRWAMYFLAKHPETQSRMYDEACDVFPSDAVPKCDDLPKMKYTKAFVLECLRMRPPIPGVHRSFSEETILGGLKFPMGTDIHLNYHVTQMDPTHWENPMEFRPERFSSEERHHPFAFVPFSTGERNCIGQKFAIQQVMILLASVVKNFTVEDCGSLDKVKMCTDPLMVPSHLKVRFISR